MIPLRSSERIYSPTPVVIGLIAANFLLFFYQVSLGFRLPTFIETWGIVPDLIARQPWALLTSMFLHGGWSHIIGNMWWLWIFGDNVEDRTGEAPGGGGFLYDLWAVVCHRGSFQGGHYVAYVRAADGRWYLCDDARVEAAGGQILFWNGVRVMGLLAVSHPRIGAVVDSWAFHVTGEPLELIGKVPKGRIVEVRLSDAPRDVPASELSHAQRLMPGDSGVIAMAPVLVQAKNAGFDGPVTPWADRSTLAGRGRERIVKLAGDRLEAAWKEAGLPIVPRWFTPVAKDAFGRPIVEESFAAVPGME